MKRLLLAILLMTGVAWGQTRNEIDSQLYFRGAAKFVPFGGPEFRGFVTVERNEYPFSTPFALDWTIYFVPEISDWKYIRDFDGSRLDHPVVTPHNDHIQITARFGTLTIHVIDAEVAAFFAQESGKNIVKAYHQLKVTVDRTDDGKAIRIRLHPADSL